jgi:predicted permease
VAVWTEIINRVQYLFRRSDFDAELDSEIEFHVEARARELERDGLPASRALVQARHEFGPTAQMREETYDAWQFRLLEDLAADLRYAARSLLRSPGFTAVAVLSLTLGIGANSTVFALAKAVLLPSIPVKNPSRLVSLYMTDERNREPGDQFMPLSYLNAEDCRKKNDVFSGMAVVLPTGADLQVSSTRIPVWVSLVSGNFFDVLGVRAELGRTFLPDEDRTGAARAVAVLSHAFWNREFGANPKIVGQSIRLNDQDYTVIGVVAGGFRGFWGSGNVDLWVPMAMNAHVLGGFDKEWFESRRAGMVSAVARLKPGVTLRQAQDSLHELAAELAREYPDDNAGRSVALMPLVQASAGPNVRGEVVLAAALMMGVAGLVLVIACGNVASLLLARATRRRQEIAMRASLGASRGRLVRQLLGESLLLAAAAGILGVLCAYASRYLIGLFLPGAANGGWNVRVDMRVLLFTLGVSALATVLFGLIPVLQVLKPDRILNLMSHQSAPSGTRWHGVRGVLVVTQVALSLIALVGAGLFIRSLRNAYRVNPGFDAKHLVVGALDLSAQHYTRAEAAGFCRKVLEQVRGLPAVESASFADARPLGGSPAYTAFPDGQRASDQQNGKLITTVAVAAGYFATARIAMLRGRDFREEALTGAQDVAVVNEELAARFWPGQDPIGKRIRFVARTSAVEVIGLVGTVKLDTLGESPQPAIYVPLNAQKAGTVVLYVRATGDEGRAEANVRAKVQSLASGVPVLYAVPVQQIVRGSLFPARMAAESLSVFGALALMLASIGTYGVMSYSVSQRTQEIGIRMVLGAQPRDVLRLIVRGGIGLVVAGILAGLALAAILARGLSSLLYGIGGFDAEVSLLVAVILILAALVACWLPARRAMRADPMIALRYE